MYVIEITKYPDRKRKAITVYDTEKPNIHYIVGYIDHNEEQFKQALIDSRYIQYIDSHGDE